MNILEDVQKAIFQGTLNDLKKIVESDQEDILSKRDKLTGSSAMHYAAYMGNLDIVEYLINQGTDSEAPNFNGERAIHYACARRHLSIVEYLLETGSDNFILTYTKWSPLHSCAMSNSVECAEALGLNAHQINASDTYGATALHVACAYNSFNMVRWLLKHQADPEIEDNRGRYPIHLACAFGSLPMVDELIRHSAVLHHVDKNERTVFHYACNATAKQSAIIELIRLLAQHTYTSQWASDQYGAFPITYAIRNHKMKVAKSLMGGNGNRSTYIFKVFLYSASVEKSSTFFNSALMKMTAEMYKDNRDEKGFTALHYAAEYDRDDRVTYLLSMGANINARSNFGVTPLHCAAINNNRHVVDVLLENGADENAVTDSGLTAMHLAASQPYPEICTMLMATGVNEFVKDRIGRTALMHLCNVIDATREACELLECFLAVPPDGDKTKKRELVAIKDNYGWTALHYAYARGHNQMAEELIKAGADVNALDNNGRNPAHLGIQSSNPTQIISTLAIRSKTILLARDNFGFLPVHYAAMKGNPAVIIDLLKQTGSPSKILPSTSHPYHLNPLHLAVIYGHVKAVEAILSFCKKGPDPSEDNIEENRVESQKIGDEDGNVSFELDGRSRKEQNYDPLTSEDSLRRIPLHYAMKYGHDKMLEMLLPADRCAILLGWKDCDEVTPLLLAAANSKEKCLEHSIKLLEKAGDTTVKRIRDSMRRCATLLSLSALNCGYNLLLSKDNCTKRDRNQRGCLHRAVFTKKNDAVENILLWAPSEARSCDKNKVTPLHLACSAGNIDGIRLLLASNANLDVEDNKKSTPADWAAASGQIDVLSFLLEQHPDCARLTDFAVSKSAEFGYTKCLQLIFKYNPEMTRCRIENKTPLHLAAQNGRDKACRFLIETGSIMDSFDKDGCSPLMLAAKSKNGPSCVEVLVGYDDCPLTCTDQDGNTALHLACLHDNPKSAVKIYEALVAREELFDVINSVNRKKETLLHLAIKMKDTEMTTRLIKHMDKQIFEKDYRNRIPLFSMIDDNAVERNMWTVLIKFIKFGREIGLDTNCEPTPQCDEVEPVAEESDGQTQPFESY